MKYAWKNLVDGKVRTLEVKSGSPEQFLPKPEHDVIIDGVYKNIASGTGTEEDPYVYETVDPISELVGILPAELEGKNLKVEDDVLVEDTAETAEQVLRAAKEEKARKGSLKKALADKILAIIAGHNEDNGLDATQIASIKASNPEVMELLSTGMPMTAKPLIEAITPDGTIITQDELDHVALEYADFAKANPDLIPA